MNDEVTVTALDLLNLALGTPEIGAVNFNLLHRFLLELVKHFALARKQINITDDIAVQAALEETRLSSSTRSPSRLGGISNVAAVEIDDEQRTSVGWKSSASVKSTPIIEAKQSVGSIATDQDEGAVDTEPALDKGAASDTAATSETPPATTPIAKGSATPRKSRTPSPRKASTVSQILKPTPPSTSPGASRTDVRRRSFEQLSTMGIYQLERRISILTAKIEALGAAPTTMEIMQQARDQQRDGGTVSGTTAGDMWQTMNLVRRIEVVEGAINGITSMLDDVNQQVRIVKDDKSFEERFNSLSSSVQNIAECLQERPISVPRDDTPHAIEVLPPAAVDHSEDLGNLKKRLSDVDKQIKGMLTKSDLQPFLTAEHINELVDEKILHKLTSSVGRRHSEKKVEKVVVQPAETEKRVEPEQTGVSAEELDERFDSVAMALEGLASKVHDFGEFRDDVLGKVADINGSLANTADKAALADLKTELSGLLNSQAPPPPVIYQEPVLPPSVSPESLQELKDSNEVKFQNIEKSLQDLRKQFFPFCDMQETVSDLSEGSELLKSDIEGIKKEIGKLVKQLEDQLAETQVIPAIPSSRKKSFNISEDEEFHQIRVKVMEMKEDLGKVETVVGDVLDDQNKKQLHLDALYAHVERLGEYKADKEQVVKDMAQKADHKDLQTRVSDEQFANSIGTLDQTVQDLLQKFAGHETSLRQAISHITSEINSKLDKVALDPVKEYLEEKLKDFHAKLDKKTAEETNTAAGTRCLLVQSANCISCDRPVNVYQDTNKPASLPFAQTFPGSKSLRPLTTFELDNVRREKVFQDNKVESFGQAKVHNELVKLGALKGSEELPELPNRPCGGNHTLTCPEKRTTIRFNKAYREDLHFIAQLTQKGFSIVDILGYDGHVYKGHVTQLPAIPDLSGNMMGRRSAAGDGPPRTSSPL